MKLGIRVPTTKRVELTVLELHWSAPVSGVAAGFECSACGGVLGERRWAIGWIKDWLGHERSMRLCEDCGMKAEASE